jgi:peptide/nickel transport system substrate-binding protein
MLRLAAAVLLVIGLACPGVASDAPFTEAPILKARVLSGDLPALSDRMPGEPIVVPPVEEIGRYGGTWRRVHMGMPDAAGWMRLTYDPLLRWSTDYSKVEPNIARSWEISEDGRVFTFHLREGMRWSDGVPFTADDFVFWYEDIVLNDKLTPVVPNWLTIGGVPGVLERVDDLTIRFRFPKTNGVILKWLASWTELVAGPPPKHYLKQFHPSYTPQADLDAKVSAEGYDTWMALYETKSNAFLNPDRPVISAWRAETGADASIFIAERNPYYWKVDPEGNQLPYIDRIEMTLVQSAETVTLKAIAGEIDMQGRRIEFVNYPLLMEHREGGNYRILRWKPATTGQGTINLNQNYSHVDPVMGKLLQDKRFRQALSLGIDRQQIINLFFMGVTQARQVVPFEDTLYGVPGTEAMYTRHDPEAANRLLDEVGLTRRDKAGYRLRPDGERLKFTIAGFTPGTAYVDVAELLAVHWKELGIQATVKPEDVALWVVRATAGEHHVSVYGASGGFRPMMDPVWFFPSAPYAYWAPLHGLWYSSGGRAGEKPTGQIARIVEIYDEAMTTLDEARQIELIKEAVTIHAENLWRIGVCGGFDAPFLVKNDFRNVPEVSFSDNPLLAPGHTHPEQYFFKR